MIIIMLLRLGWYRLLPLAAECPATIKPYSSQFFWTGKPRLKLESWFATFIPPIIGSQS